MKREIKQRGFNRENKSWYFGHYLFAHNMTYIFSGDYCAIGDEDPTEYFKEIVPESVSDFIGLMDKNGKEIYEDDIVKHFGMYNHVVKFNYGAFGYDGSMDDDFISYNQNAFNLKMNGKQLMQVEIIGNIHENPELLKEVKNG